MVTGWSMRPVTVVGAEGADLARAYSPAMMPDAIMYSCWSHTLKMDAATATAAAMEMAVIWRPWSVIGYVGGMNA